MKYWVSKACMGIIALLLLLPGAVQAATKLPAPTDAFFVNDFANVMDSADEALMIENGRALEELNGAQVVIVTVDSVGSRSLSDYAADLFNEWGVGDAKKDNGLLILLSIGDDDYWAVQGRGLESTLTSGTISDILYDYLETDFAKQAYSAGAKKVYAAFVRQLGGTWTNSVAPETSGNEREPAAGTGGTGKSAGSPTSGAGSEGKSFPIFWVFVILFILFIIIVGRRSNRTGRTRHRSNPYSPPYRYPPPPPRPPYRNNGWGRNSGGRGSSGGGWFGGGSSGGSRGSSGSSGGFFGGGGSTRGGGAGRSGGSGSSGSRGGFGGFSGGGRGGSSGGPSRGGGGSTRGGGAGRRK